MATFTLREEQRIEGGQYAGYKRAVVANVPCNLHHIINLTRYPDNPNNRDYDYQRASDLTEQYVKNEGKYICYQGLHLDPFSFINFIADHGYRFTKVTSSFTTPLVIR